MRGAVLVGTSFVVPLGDDGDEVTQFLQSRGSNQAERTPRGDGEGIIDIVKRVTPDYLKAQLEDVFASLQVIWLELIRWWAAVLRYSQKDPDTNRRLHLQRREGWVA